MPYEYIHQPINTYIHAQKGKFFIKAFEWEGSTYKITHNNLIAKAKKGTIPVYLFAVSNETAAFKLRFDTDTLNWWLEEITWVE